MSSERLPNLNFLSFTRPVFLLLSEFILFPEVKDSYDLILISVGGIQLFFQLGQLGVLEFICLNPANLWKGTRKRLSKAKIPSIVETRPIL